jgi:anthranilate phosphoribosyltransferase
MIKEAINILVSGINLSETEMAECVNEIMEGRSTDAQIGAFLAALRIKGETVDEITGAARIMRAKAAKINAPEGVLDTCGTGGDMSHTFNISTTVAIVVAASGIPVAKHGNRSVSSKSGSADVLEALGVKIDLLPEKVEKCLFETVFGFLFAPLFHPMKYAIGPRREWESAPFSTSYPIGKCGRWQILGILNPYRDWHRFLATSAQRMRWWSTEKTGLTR